MNKEKIMIPIISGVVSFIIFVILQRILGATDVQGFILVATIVICMNLWGIAMYFTDLRKNS